MEMTTPVFTRRTNAEGEKMDMTTPVITIKVNFFNCLVFFHHSCSLLFVKNSLLQCLKSQECKYSDRVSRYAHSFEMKDGSLSDSNYHNIQA